MKNNLTIIFALGTITLITSVVAPITVTAIVARQFLKAICVFSIGLAATTTTSIIVGRSAKKNLKSKTDGKA